MMFNLKLLSLLALSAFAVAVPTETGSDLADTESHLVARGFAALQKRSPLPTPKKKKVSH